MLEIINNLAVFFEDCYRWISVREYAGIIQVSPPTASSLLKNYAKEGYLRSRAERRHLFFQLNNENSEVVDLSRIYWKSRLQETCRALEKQMIDAIVLFGSLAKAEATEKSDIDLAVFSTEKPEIDLAQKKLRRTINIHWFTSLHAVKNKHLLNNIINGAIIRGKVRW
ncbi:MAG TPA: nucleotidyltransferase domain-containing protein [Candidatus Nanoarchaeia archaeon]|nr:nucleotidyltransferase domain-containing protein [Candidatus Nanoarchaeia archaeon]